MRKIHAPAPQVKKTVQKTATTTSSAAKKEKIDSEKKIAALALL